MNKIEQVNIAVCNLQKAVAAAIKEDMPEQSKYVSRIWYVGKCVHVFSDGLIQVVEPSPELKEQCSRLKLAELYSQQKELQEKLDSVNGKIKEVEP